MKILMAIIAITSIFSIVVEQRHGIFSSSYQYLLAEMDTEVTGVIERSRSRTTSGYRGAGTLLYDIEYSYVVEGEEFRNHLVAYEKKNETVGQRLKKYPVGEKITVHHDSSSPQWSVLEQGNLSIYIYIQLAMNLIMAPLGTYLLARYTFDL
jgi:hypothetical protein